MDITFWIFGSNYISPQFNYMFFYLRQLINLLLIVEHPLTITILVMNSNQIIAKNSERYFKNYKSLSKNGLCMLRSRNVSREGDRKDNNLQMQTVRFE